MLCRGRKPTKEEAFLLQLLEAPTLKQLLVTAKHVRSATSAAESVSKDLRILAQACSDVHESSTLRKVLRYTLDMGNFLNAGSNNACAAGFNVEDLLKLKEVKGSGKSPGCKSLLHFLAKQLLQVCPQQDLATARLFPRALFVGSRNACSVATSVSHSTSATLCIATWAACVWWRRVLAVLCCLCRVGPEHVKARMLVVLQDLHNDETSDPCATPTRADEAGCCNVAAAIRAVKQELAGCGPAGQLDITATRKNLQDASTALKQVSSSVYLPLA
jgi:hypothetical protein